MEGVGGQVDQGEEGGQQPLAAAAAAPLRGLGLATWPNNQSMTRHVA